jgi:hypothetical protein
MDLTNVPRRAYEKLRKDGVVDTLSTGTDVLLVDILFYRLCYNRLLHDRLPALSQDYLRERDCPVREPCDETVRHKGAAGLHDPEMDPKASYHVGDRFVCTFDDATVFGPTGLGTDDRNQVIAETAGSPTLVPRRIGIDVAKSMSENGVERTLTALRDTVEPDVRFDTVAAALPTWTNYYHWTIECLPRIRLLEAYGERTGDYPELLVPTDRPTWMDETLYRIDYGGKLVAWDGGIASADRLVVPTFPEPVSVDCRWLRDRMYDRTHAERNEGKLIYISRADATLRRVRNMEQIRPILNTYGVETYVLSELSVAEQVELFAEAELIVAPHGAGLTNIVYADEAAVVELFGDKKAASFARLAKLLGHDYTYLDCDERGVDIVVDPTKLERMLEAAVGDRSDDDYK